MAIYVDDEQLVAAHKAGDTDAFDELVSEHRSVLLAHARKKLLSAEAAEDALQETLIRAYRALPRFNGQYKLGPWLHRIMANVCVDEINRRRRDSERFDNVSSQPSVRTHSPGVEEELGLEFDDTELNLALDELPATHREALELRFVDELEYNEVASVVGASEQNVRARVSRARASVRSALKGVAVLPLFLVGLLKRGEKAAAAATSSTSAMVGGSGLTKVGLAAQATPSVSAALPTLAEAASTAAHVAPAAVPAIAKAAVGIGLAAAVLTPNADGALHHVVQSVATDAGNEMLLSSREEVSDQITVGQLATPEDLSNTSVNSSFVSVGAGEASLANTANTEVPTILLSSDQLSVEQAGAGRMRLQGAAPVQWAAGEISGTIGAASQIRISDELNDSEGRQRFDGLLVINPVGLDKPLELRIAGFVASDAQVSELSGVYRLSSPIETLVQTEGQIEGKIELPSEESTGSLELILQ